MKKIIILFAFAVLPFICNAQSLKFGYVNAQEIFQLMPELDSIEKVMAEYNSTNLEYLKAMEDEIQEKYNKYESEREKLSEAIRKVTEEEINALAQRYQTAVESLRNDMQKKQMELLEPVNQRIRDAIEKVGKKNGFIFIFDLGAESILYKSDQATDVSTLVKKELGIL